MVTTALTTRQLRQLLRSWIASGALETVLPELAALRGILQPEEYHAEGDAYVHTLLAVEQLSDNDDPRLFWAVLLHDIGKASTTRFIDGRWRALGHDRIGATLAKTILARLNLEPLIEDVTWLIVHHHFATSWGASVERGLSSRQLRHCYHPLFPLLCRLCHIDAAASMGISRKGEMLSRIEKLVAMAAIDKPV